MLAAVIMLAGCGHQPDLGPLAIGEIGIPDLPKNLEKVYEPPAVSTFSVDKGEGHQALDATLAWGTANYLQNQRFRTWIADLRDGQAPAGTSSK